MGQLLRRNGIGHPDLVPQALTWEMTTSCFRRSVREPACSAPGAPATARVRDQVALTNAARRPRAPVPEDVRDERSDQPDHACCPARRSPARSGWAAGCSPARTSITAGTLA